ncbi:radical SAM protein [candidate division KSB1 bacterium]|nr:radical SAM protein [candidate division KSB1 bacterium]
MQVCEIFYSLQGESGYSGQPCVFVRLTGCNIRCQFCDTTYAYDTGTSMAISDVINQVQQFGISLVEITGGEPLLQSETVELALQLADLKYTVLVETNGTLPINVLKAPIIRIMDIKCPCSNESDKMDWQNLEYLRSGDEIKFVVQDRNDFDYVQSIIRKYPQLKQYPVHLSPVHHVLPPEQLAAWILESKQPVRLHLQLHKLLNLK